MYPREYFDSLWRTDIRDEVFVAMPFSGFDSIWSSILMPAIKDSGLKPHRVDVTKVSGSIITEIMDGIAHARLVLGDVSPVSGDYSNANVMYEIGMAHALRQPCEVLLVSRERIPRVFDIGSIRIHLYNPEKPVQHRREISALIATCLKEADVTRSQRVSKAIASLDGGALTLISLIRRWKFIPESGTPHPHRPVRSYIYNYRRANPFAVILSDSIIKGFYKRSVAQVLTEETIRRLLDLGILCSSPQPGRPTLYRWTNFGRAVIAALNSEEKLL